MTNHILALGEPTHGEEVLLQLRNDFFRQRVEQDGYRTIALESDCLMGLLVDDYVTTGTGDLDDVMKYGFSHEWGAFPGNRELVRWMRAYNESRARAEQVRFAGFDGPLEITHAASPRPALTALHEYLGVGTDELDRLLGADERWTNPAVMRDPSQSVGQTADAQQLRLIADDLAALLYARTPELKDLDRGRLYARTATGLLRYHARMADPSPSRLEGLLTARDSMMAANLLALAERGPTLVSAHNSHLQRPQSTMRMGGARQRWWSAGAIAGAHLGDRYAFLATAVGTIRHQGVDTPPPDTIEGILYALPEERIVIDAPRLAALVGDVTPAPRVSPWYGYAPLDPAHLADLDGLIFVKELRGEADRRPE
jgi:erythromycin esterase-like protein